MQYPNEINGLNIVKSFSNFETSKTKVCKTKKCRRIIVAVWVGLFLLSVITIALQASISRNCLASTYALYCPTVLVYLCIFPLFGLPSPTDKMLSILISWRWNVTAICWRELQREGKNILPPRHSLLAIQSPILTLLLLFQLYFPSRGHKWNKHAMYCESIVPKCSVYGVAYQPSCPVSFVLGVQVRMCAPLVILTAKLAKRTTNVCRIYYRFIVARNSLLCYCNYPSILINV